MLGQQRETEQDLSLGLHGGAGWQVPERNLFPGEKSTKYPPAGIACPLPRSVSPGERRPWENRGGAPTPRPVLVTLARPSEVGMEN